MIKSAVTISLVPEAKGGPFVYWDNLPENCAKAARLGFDAVEIFPPSGPELDRRAIEAALKQNGLQLAALGTGAGWVKKKLHLTHADPAIRRQAAEFIQEVSNVAGEFGAATIIGSMQGRVDPGQSRDEALKYLAEALAVLGNHATSAGSRLLVEPLNRYETNLLNRAVDGIQLIRGNAITGVTLLMDLFHMNIEERSIPEALKEAGPLLGHVHFVDSNRRPAGNGHLDYASIIAALTELNYEGFLSAEALPFPDSDSAAAQTIQMFREFFHHV
ncbi:MAG: sugar phosphate isomerase/epimerase family protein [Verrucomicrobiota bacterium]|nr:sugar phosphate isomerase/epimerase family protein [Verrucomicrobiota bacterium]